MKNLNRTALVLALAVSVPVAVSAATDNALQGMIDELTTLLNQGEKERRIDPWLLRDVRGVIAKYHDPWRRQVLADDFSGQGPNPGRPWVVTAGEFLVDWRYGLRSVVRRPEMERRAAAAPPRQPEPAERRDSGDATQQLIGALLQQALGPRRSESGPQPRARPQPSEPPPAPPEASPAEVAARVEFGNAFAAELEITARRTGDSARGSFELGPYQGARREAGYRLVYEPGRSPSLSLVAFTPRRQSTLELYNEPLDLADGKVHALTWTRDRNGDMRIALDGKELIRVTDRSFRDPFAGFAITNRGGDYAVRRIKINDAR